LKHRDYRRFVILSSPRCGTHMLRTSFAGHPSVVAHTELFNPDWNPNEPFDDSVPAERILREHVFRPHPRRIGAVGFALHRSGARLGPWPHLWTLLEADVELAVISLRRNDLLRRYVSFCLMRERNQSGRGAAFRPAPRAYRAEDLQAEFERAEAELAAFDDRFATHPLLPVSYEQLCDDYGPTLRRLQAFLGVRPQPVRPTTWRNEGPPLEELITNFDELAETFGPTRWAWYFRRVARAVRLRAQAGGTLEG
jgi:hypothetical protein